MFVINEEDNSIYITRGDVAFFTVSSSEDDGEVYKFQPGDVVRFKVFEKRNCENVVLSKDFGIEEETEEVLIYLEEKDTKIGDVISKPVEYWYEVELNPYTDPQTIIGYDDEDGAKIFRLFPEGAEAEDDVPVTPEDIPVVDEELDLTSTRPVQNQAISRAIFKIKSDVKAEQEGYAAEIRELMESYSESFDATLEECKNFVFEDISDKFIFRHDGGCDAFELSAYKRGNVITVNLYVKLASTYISPTLPDIKNWQLYFNSDYESRMFLFDVIPYTCDEGVTAHVSERTCDVLWQNEPPEFALSFTYFCK